MISQMSMETVCYHLQVMGLQVHTVEGHVTKSLQTRWTSAELFLNWIKIMRQWKCKMSCSSIAPQSGVLLDEMLQKFRKNTRHMQNTLEWKHLQIAVILYQYFRNLAVSLCKTVMETLSRFMNTDTDLMQIRSDESRFIQRCFMLLPLHNGFPEGTSETAKASNPWGCSASYVL